MTFTESDERRLQALIERKATWENERSEKLHTAINTLCDELGTDLRRDHFYSLLVQNASMMVEALREFLPDRCHDTDQFRFAAVCVDRQITPVRYYKSLDEVCASLGDESEVHRLMIQRWRPGCHTALADGRILFCFKE